MAKRINQTDLLNFFHGNCSPEESIYINQFLKTPTGQDLLNELLNNHWNHIPGYEIDKKTLLKWKKEWSLKFKKENPVVKIKRIKFNRIFPYAAVFAALILGIGMYSVFTKKIYSTGSERNLVVQKNPNGAHSTIKLSDGTQVYLGPGSELTFPKNFSGDIREVKLLGEAYFEVTKNKQKPFVILTGDIKTQVLGTTFKINAFKGRAILVSVTSGKVRVDRVNGDEIQNLAVLLPGEQLSYRNATKIVKSDFNIEYLKDWKKGRLVFNATPFHEMTEEIGRWYNLDFVIEQTSLLNIPITLTLDANVPIKELLNTLSVTLGFDYELTGKRVIIK